MTEGAARDDGNDWTGSGAGPFFTQNTRFSIEKASLKPALQVFLRPVFNAIRFPFCENG
jgi:hypothetical protein